MKLFDEIKITERIIRGDTIAFELLFKEYYSSLCSYAKKITHQKEISEEIVQETFYKIWERRGELSIHTSIKSYLFRAVHNNSIKYLQSKKFEDNYKKFNGNVIVENPEYIPDFELSEKLNASIKELPPQCRKIFTLSRFDKLKYEEIALKLGISIRTVEVQIRRANIALREKLQEFMPIILIISIWCKGFIY